MRTKVEYRMASRQNYEKFCLQNPQIKLSFLEWSNIIYSFNYGLRDYALETGDIIRLPWGFGELTITKKRRKKQYQSPDGKTRINLAIDWVKTKKAGKYIYHMNHHSDGFNFKWKWYPLTAKFKYHKTWIFKPSRISSRLIAHYVSQGYATKYKEWHTIKR